MRFSRALCRRMLLGLGVIALTVKLTAGVTSAEETKEARVVRLQAMSALEKDKLRRNQERLESLPPDQQQQLRDLEQQLSVDPQEAQLRQVMLRYHAWLRALPSAERAELLSLVEADRVQKIKALLAQQELQRLPQLAKESLTSQDVEEVRAWVGDLMVRRKEELIEMLPPHSRQKLVNSDDPRQLGFAVMNFLRERDRGRPSSFMEVLQVTEEDRQRLVQKLSAPAQDVYRQAGADADKKRTVFQYWFFAAFRPRPPSQTELQEFFQRLPSQEQDRLVNLPPEQMNAELTRKYFIERTRRWDKDMRPGERFKGRPEND